MNTLSANAFRGILIVVGAVIVLIGINVGGGGIQTLGLQGTRDFLAVTNEHRYTIQDNHVRFLGGLFGAMGIFMLFAATNPTRYQTGLQLVFILVFIGGLTRFTSLRPDIVFSPDSIVSTLTELVLMPILYFWLPRMVKVLPTS